MDKELTSLLWSLGWTLFKYVLGLTLFALVVGFVVGIFTYGKPMKKSRDEGFLVDAADVGMMLMHALIGKIYGGFKGNSKGTSWLNDRETIALLRGLSPGEFEEYVARMFESLGYRTTVTGGSGDGGVDIEMTKDGRDYVVQCKKYFTQKVTPSEVRDFYGAMGHRHINGKGFLVTTHIFTFQAEKFAEGKPIELIDEVSLIELVRRSGIFGTDAQLKGESVQLAAPIKFEAEKPKSSTCPWCGQTLVQRTNHKTSNQFWGCSGFPKCRYTRPV